jgi:hypothetical protein
MATEIATNQHPVTLSRAWYGASIDDFMAISAEAVYGNLSRNSDFDVVTNQRNAWVEQIELLKSALKGLSGSLFLEFNIPRMGRRIDLVLLLGPVVFVVEFKTGDSEFSNLAMDQVWDYALDLKNFHAASHHVSLVPILVASTDEASPGFSLQADADNVYRPIQIKPDDLRRTIDEALRQVSGVLLNESQWAAAPYCPNWIGPA